MPYIENNGCELYYEYKPVKNRPTIILIHGYLGSADTWKQAGYLRYLYEFSILIFDRRGYGRSSKPHEVEEYTIEKKCSDVIALMNALEIKKAVVWGFSGGGKIAYGMIKYHSKRLIAAVVGGMSPYTLPPEYDMEQRIRLLEQGMDAVVQNFEQMYGVLPPLIRENILKNDPFAIKADVLNSIDFEGFAGDLPYFDVPVFLYVGEKDPFLEGCKRACEVIPNCTFLFLKGLGHYETLVKTKYFVREVIDFLNLH